MISLLIGTVVSSWQAVVAIEAKTKAIQSERLEKEAKEKAKASSRMARLNQYLADVNLAHRFFLEGNTERARQFLLGVIPEKGEEDFGGFEWRYLWALFGVGRPVILSGQNGPIRSLSFSPDSAWLASSTRRGNIAIWDVSSKERIASWIGDEGTIVSVDFSHDGRVLASASIQGDEEGRVRLWDLSELPGKPIGLPMASFGNGFNGRFIETYNALFSPVAAILAYQAKPNDSEGPTDVVLYQYEVDRTIRLPRAGAVLAYSPDGAYLATGADSTIQIWDVEKADLLSTIENASDLSCQFLPGGDRLITNRGRQMLTWDWKVGVIVDEPYRCHEEVYGSRVGRTGELLAISDYSRVRLVELPYFNPLQTLSSDGAVVLHSLQNEEESLLAMPVEFDRDSRNHLRSLPTPVTRDDRYIAISDSDRRVQVCNTLNLHPEFSIERAAIPVRFSPDDSHLRMVEFTGEVLNDRFTGLVSVVDWEWRKGSVSELGSFEVDEIAYDSGLQYCDDPANPFLLFRRIDGSLVVDLRDFSQHELKHQKSYFSVFSPNASLFAGGAEDDSISIWNTSDWSSADRITGSRSHFGVFRSDSQLLVIDPLSKFVKRWQIDPRVEFPRLDTGVARIYCGDVTSDGQTLVLGGSGSMIEFWNLETGRRVLSLQHDTEIGELRFSPDETFLTVKSKNLFSSKESKEIQIQILKADRLDEIEASREWQEFVGSHGEQ